MNLRFSIGGRDNTQIFATTSDGKTKRIATAIDSRHADMIASQLNEHMDCYPKQQRVAIAARVVERKRARKSR